jgi:hypothetical protein
MMRGWLFIIELWLLLCAPAAMARPAGGFHATQLARLERLSDTSSRPRTFALKYRLSSRENLSASIGYLYGQRSVTLLLDYRAQYEIPYTRQTFGVIMPLAWGVRGRVEQDLSGLARGGRLALQLPLSTWLQLPYGRILILLEVAPGVTLAQAQLGPVLEGRLGFSYAF